MPHIIEIPGVGQVEFPDSMSDDDITTASAKLHSDKVAELEATHAKRKQEGVLAEQRVKNVETTGNIIGGIMRAGGAILGGPPGAAFGSMAAESVEKAGRGESPEPTLSAVPRSAVSAGISAIPGGWLGKPASTLGKVAVGAGEGAVIGAGTSAAAPLLEGKRPTLEGVASGAATGGILGGATSGLGSALAKRRAIKHDPESAVNDVLKAFKVKGSPGAPGAEIAPEIEYFRTAHPEVHHELLRTGALFEKVGPRGYAQAAQRIKKSGWQEDAGKDLQTYGHQLEPTTSVADEIYNSIGSITQQANPKLKEEVIKRANLYDKQSHSLTDIQDRIKELRKTREQLNNPLTRAEILNTPEMATNMRELNGLEKVFSKRMTQLTGKDYKQISFRYKALSNAEEMARDAAGAEEVASRQASATRHKVVDTALESQHLYQAGAKLAKQGLKRLHVDPNDPTKLIAASLKKMGGHSKRVPIRSVAPELSMAPPTSTELVRTKRERTMIPPPPTE